MSSENGMIIEVDSEFAIKIGFTSDKFEGWLWRDDKRIMFSFICSKNPKQGNLSTLIKTIEGMGLSVAIPTPLGKMVDYLSRRNFVPHISGICNISLYKKST
ncbi:hypothetical protein [Aulosira sp. FACHB-615]|uniref:hypothetical protein n=1 Tax=Aulosira sp. FACHB-615 TaxID=2692777 RepID=UPI0016834FE2|nr:hypothetical protein [Aulosira sp. FACHB-615]MBD2492618.1 hypothetical protein [Aulosira sp. FACHB-615]